MAYGNVIINNPDDRAFSAVISSCISNHIHIQPLRDKLTLFIAVVSVAAGGQAKSSLY